MADRGIGLLGIGALAIGLVRCGAIAEQPAQSANGADPSPESDQDPKDAVGVAAKGVDEGGHSACDGLNEKECMALADRLWAGGSDQRDVHGARQLFEGMCESGNSSACFRLAMSLRNDEPKRVEDAEELYERACRDKVGGACTNLADILEERGSLEDAAQLYRLACSAKDAAACTNLAHMYRHGRGVSENMTRAAQLNSIACELNSPRGCNNLGDMYESGEGVGRDMAQARQLYERACAKPWEGQTATCCERVAREDNVRRHGFGCYSLALLLKRTQSTDSARIQLLLKDACEAGVVQACQQRAANVP